MLYIHTPICNSKCYYCDFYSVSNRGVNSQRIVERMVEEIQQRGKEIESPLTTIYFGGGTPSLLTLEQVAMLITAASSAFDISEVEEITFEANPEGLNLEYLIGLKKLGINRLSIGIQSFNNKRLSEIGRRHSSEVAIKGVELAREAGFRNISVDLMFGFSNHTLKEWQRDIEMAVELGVEHISAYQLSIEPGTVFAKRGVELASDEECEALYLYLDKRLREAGFEHYEISSYARQGFRSRHNSGYWMGRAYVGIGAAAHSYNGSDKRSWNVASIVKYLGGESAQSEVLSRTEQHNEYLMCRLRTSDGIDLKDYRERFGCNFEGVSGVVIEGGRAYIEPKDFFKSDMIISSLFK